MSIIDNNKLFSSDYVGIVLNLSYDSEKKMVIYEIEFLAVLIPNTNVLENR